jgi:hypothetical protein
MNENPDFDPLENVFPNVENDCQQLEMQLAKSYSKRLHIM